MPIDEIEYHPYLNEGQINGATKLILGSFPVYECTNPDNEIKKRNRDKEGTFRFFYGSVDSRFWSLYVCYIDKSINMPFNKAKILQSLNKKHIAIADTILSCERHCHSSEDNKLIRKKWNKEGVQTLIQNGITKILCTSKGVLSDLETQIICNGDKPLCSLDEKLSTNFQSDFIKELNGSNSQITNPIAKVFLINNNQITALAIPSPGSPYRQIKQFGFVGKDKKAYTIDYFLKAFSWLNQ